MVFVFIMIQIINGNNLWRSDICMYLKQIDRRGFGAVVSIDWYKHNGSSFESSLSIYKLVIIIVTSLVSYGLCTHFIQELKLVDVT